MPVYRSKFTCEGRYKGTCEGEDLFVKSRTDNTI